MVKPCRHSWRRILWLTTAYTPFLERPGQIYAIVIPTIVPECFSILRYFDTHPSSYWTSSTLMSTLPTIHLLFNNWTFALQVTKQVTTTITAVHINQPCIDSGLCYFIVITSNLHLGFWYSQVLSESWLMKCLCCKQHFHRLVDFFSYCS